MSGQYTAKNQIMEAYMRLAQRLFKEFELAYIEKFPRTSSSRADALAALALAIDSDLKRTI